MAVLDNSKLGLQETTDLLCKYSAYNSGLKVNASKGGGVTASFAGAFLEKDPGRGKKGSVFSAKKAKVAKKAIAFLTFGFALLD